MEQNAENDLIERPAVDERDAVPEDFIGKTVTGFDSSADNIWRFTFSDGTSLAIEAEVQSTVFGGIPFMQICVPCGVVPPEEDETEAVAA